MHLFFISLVNIISYGIPIVRYFGATAVIRACLELVKSDGKNISHGVPKLEKKKLIYLIVFCTVDKV